MLNLCQTIFVCFALTISSILFENDADKLVLKPLEIMIEIVDKVATANLIECLLGPSVPPRREYLLKHSEEANEND